MPTFYARHEYTGDGANKNFSVAFPYLDPDHVKVLVNAVESAAWTWFGGSLIVMDTAPTNGDAVIIYRDSSRNARLVDFTSPGVTDTVLNTDSLQAFYLAQEAVDTANSVLVSAATLQLDAAGRRITNVANPVDDQDAATKTWVLNTTAAAIPAADAAAASATAAAASAATAATSENNAATSETNAASSASAAALSVAEAATNASAATMLYGFKNKLINAEMKVNQRDYTGHTWAAGGILSQYLCDRWQAVIWDADVEYDWKKTSTKYDHLNRYLRVMCTRNGIVASFNQKIEDVRTLAGETVTLSFWARTINGSADVPIKMRFSQQFGAGSTDTAVEATQPIVTVSSVFWTRYSTTLTLPSVDGKDIKDDSFLQVGWRLDSGVIGEFDVALPQLELGSVATDFEHRPYAVEDLLCKRYYYECPDEVRLHEFDDGANGAAAGYICTQENLFHPVEMRTTPTTSTGVTGSGAASPAVVAVSPVVSHIRLISTGAADGPVRWGTCTFTLDAEF